MHKYSFIVFWLLAALIVAPGCEQDTSGQPAERARHVPRTLPELIEDSIEAFADIDSADLDGLLKRIGDARLVLLGEATHGTAEFYEMRARISRELIEKKGFNIIAVEADWPDATSIDHYIHAAGRGSDHQPGFIRKPTKKPFSDFPHWMWANHSVLAFVDGLKSYNQSLKPGEGTVSFYGLDFYNMFSSIEAVLDYLQAVDPYSAQAAHRLYRCLLPWAYDPSDYSRVIRSRKHPGCEHEVDAVLQEVRKIGALDQPLHSEQDRHQYFLAEQHARLVKNAEQFYRSRTRADNDSRNLRHQSLFETLLAILDYHGETSKVIVWAHNSHIGDARATDMRAHGEANLGQRVRETFGDSAYLVGFGTDHGTVSAATRYGGPVNVMQLRPADSDSYEGLFHEVSTKHFLLPLRQPLRQITRQVLLPERLQRAIGTSYDPDDELNKHYIYASLPAQFDEYIWFDETRAVQPLSSAALQERPSTEAMLQGEAGLLNK